MSPWKTMWTLLVLVVVLVGLMQSAPSTKKSKKAKQATTTEAQKFYEVDALGDDYVDFGAATGPKGSYTWHATYRLEH